jgi:hypothetical protein
MHGERARLLVGTAERDREDGLARVIGDLDLLPLPHPHREEALLPEFREGAPHRAGRHRGATG